eukprot:TRINITY_DN2503_c0_g1_i1.p1 TRINITY_DN2503_c0_g1~~TRINITY_DN2503_c0_g1_i1.p1  ORF type:complete len:594 (+),score=319.72 TRINITY_DN2503_c0_g1_i1:24-1784(+)
MADTKPQNPRPPKSSTKKSKGAANEDESISCSTNPSLKTAKGTRDYHPGQMVIRERVFSIITSCFKKHGAVTIETPVFELKEILTNKYGEDSKLIYDLQDQGGEICSLRYDLTVPFARYVAMNRVKAIKRYHIARVYRRDSPVMTKGRFREFYQCDYDIAGNYDLMIPDAECLKLMVEILTKVQVGDFKIKLNHRKLLDGVFAICGVPEDNFRPISSAIDKLDKSPWDEVRKEMIEKKDLAPEIADKIHEFVKLNGSPKELLAKLIADGKLNESASAKKALEELQTLFEFTDCYGVTDSIILDLSLARGLDYYTGVIYEAVLTDGKAQVGSIAAGGRYDDLVGSLGGGEQIPAVGFSVGVERIFSILEKKALAEDGTLKSSQTQVFVVSVDSGCLKERMAICSDLWNHGIRAEFLPKNDPKMRPQLNTANTLGVEYAVIFGRNEMELAVLLLKNMKTGKQETVPRCQIGKLLSKLLTEGDSPKGSEQDLKAYQDRADQADKLISELSSKLQQLETIIEQQKKPAAAAAAAAPVTCQEKAENDAEDEEKTNETSLEAIAKKLQSDLAKAEYRIKFLVRNLEEAEKSA